MLKIIFHNSLHLNSSLIIKEKIKIFINKLINQASTLYFTCIKNLFLFFKVKTGVKKLKFTAAKLFSIKIAQNYFKLGLIFLIITYLQFCY